MRMVYYSCYKFRCIAVGLSIVKNIAIEPVAGITEVLESFATSDNPYGPTNATATQIRDAYENFATLISTPIVSDQETYWSGRVTGDAASFAISLLALGGAASKAATSGSTVSTVVNGDGTLSLVGAAGAEGALGYLGE